MTNLNMIGASVLACLAVSQLCGQPNNAKPGHIDRPARMHGFAEKPLRAVGQRMIRPGLERGTYSGTLVDSSGTSPIVLIREQPDKIRLQVGGARPFVLVADENGRSLSSRGNVSELELDLMESLSADSLEVFLANLAEGAAGRFLGSGFRPTENRSLAYRGPLNDIFELFAGVRIRNNQLRAKRYFFDGATGLLSRVRYTKNLTAVETRFSNWEDRNGEKVPATVQRFENGQAVFSLSTTATVFEAKKSDNAFARP